MHSWTHFWTPRPGHPCCFCFSWISRRIFSISSCATQCPETWFTEEGWKRLNGLPVRAMFLDRGKKNQPHPWGPLQVNKKWWKINLVKNVKNLKGTGRFGLWIFVSACWSLLMNIEPPSRSKPATLGSVHNCKLSTHRWSSYKRFQHIHLQHSKSVLEISVQFQIYIVWFF